MPVLNPAGDRPLSHASLHRCGLTSSPSISFVLTLLLFFLFLFLLAFPTDSEVHALMISTLQRMSLAAFLDRIIERFEDVLDR
jgi:hypothetical protein